MDRNDGGSPACRRLRTHQNRQARWGKANHPDISRTSAQRHPDIREATLQTLLTPPGHLKNQPKWSRTPLMTCVASPGKPGQLPQMRSSCLETSEASSGGSSSSSSITQKIIDVVFPVRIFNKVCEARQLRALWGKPQHADASGHT